jgi:type III pantothenate kinase
MRTLLLDLGNTRLKWKFINELSLSAVSPDRRDLFAVSPDRRDLFAVSPDRRDLSSSATEALVHGDALDCWQALLSQPKPERVLLASVSPVRAQTLVALIQRQWRLPVEVVLTPAEFQLSSGQTWRNSYAEPQRLGVDRFVAMLAAMRLFPGQTSTVVMVGTAMTLDALSADGQHIGGLILPGPNLMRASLHQNTAALPRIDVEPKSGLALGTNTQDAIMIASFRAGAALINEHVQQSSASSCAIGGGASTPLLSYLSCEYQHLPELVLAGLESMLDQQ